MRSIVAWVRGLRLRRGIDVSAHQGDIDWKKVRASGIRFAWVKCSEGGDYVDPRFSESRVRAIRAAKLKFGPYHYLRPRRDRNGAEEAAHAVKTAKAVGWKPSKRWLWGRRDFPLCVDVERGGNEAELNAMTGAQLREYVSDFCDGVKRRTGRGCVVYLSPGFAAEFGGEAPRHGDVCWAAAWDAPDGNPPVPKGWRRRHCRFHQTSDRGTVPGIQGRVDLNVYIRLGGGHPAPDPAVGTKRVQRLLQGIGWPIVIDGKMGAQTRRAIRDFQRGYARETLTIDGLIGPKTATAMDWSAGHGGRCSEHFTFREWRSWSTPGGCKGNEWIWVMREEVRAFEAYRRLVGHPVAIVSGCRDPEKNRCVGGATVSQHLYGSGGDMRPEKTVAQVRALHVFSGIGFDRASGLVRHGDVRHKSGHNPTGGTLQNPTIWAYS